MIKYLPFYLFAFLLVLTGCTSDTSEPPADSPTHPAAITGFLKDLRKGHVPEYIDMEVLEPWLEKTLLKGKTTRGEAAETLGTHYRDIDRPGHDETVTWEYFLGPPGSTGTWYHLVLDFSTETKLLLDWHIEITTDEEE
jgi:hypothetical protein